MNSLKFPTDLISRRQIGSWLYETRHSEEELWPMGIMEEVINTQRVCKAKRPSEPQV